jgi:hypothetical protein
MTNKLLISSLEPLCAKEKKGCADFLSQKLEQGVFLIPSEIEMCREDISKIYVETPYPTLI